MWRFPAHGRNSPHVPLQVQSVETPQRTRRSSGSGGAPVAVSVSMSTSVALPAVLRDRRDPLKLPRAARPATCPASAMSRSESSSTMMSARYCLTPATRAISSTGCRLRQVATASGSDHEHPTRPGAPQRVSAEQRRPAGSLIGGTPPFLDCLSQLRSTQPHIESAAGASMPRVSPGVSAVGAAHGFEVGAVGGRNWSRNIASATASSGCSAVTAIGGSRQPTSSQRCRRRSSAASAGRRTSSSSKTAVTRSRSSRSKTPWAIRVSASRSRALLASLKKCGVFVCPAGHTPRFQKTDNTSACAASTTAPCASATPTTAAMAPPAGRP